MKGAQKHLNVILYDKEQVPVQTVNHNNIIATDIRGLGTGVGGFSNCATVIETMKAIFNKDTHKEQYDELVLRKKLLREIVGAEIDRIKGTTAPVLPSEWKKIERILPEDSEEVKQKKYKHNSLVLSKKPYFFRYLYPALNKRYKQYEAAYDILSKDMFGIKFKKLLVKKDKTEAEKNLIRRYQKYSPLIVSNCTMNLLCKEFENIDLDIKFKDDNVNLLPLYQNMGYKADEEILAQFRTAYRKYNNQKAVKLVSKIFIDADDEDAQELKFHITNAVKSEVQEDIFKLKLDTKEILFYIGQLSQEYKKFNWGFAWDLLEDFIVSCIPYGHSYAPVRNENGEEYLGQRYILKDVSKEVEVNEED